MSKSDFCPPRPPKKIISNKLYQNELLILPKNKCCYRANPTTHQAFLATHQLVSMVDQTLPQR